MQAVLMVSDFGVNQSQVKFHLLHERLERLGALLPISADTAATETYYIKGYYDLEETINVQKSELCLHKE